MDKVNALIMVLLLISCSADSTRKRNRILEPVNRRHDERLFNVPAAIDRVRQRYPWEAAFIGEHPRITKEYFYCNGSALNPIRDGLSDCGGMSEHGLSYIDGEEGIYPILIELLNYVQEKTGNRVIITCGHRCPQHNVYSDPSKFNETSKHMIGAEVDFYVQGLEEEPEAVIGVLQSYFPESFRRFDKETNVSTPPWYNSEIFIKLFRHDEGRDLDNRHPYPYISVQVRGHGAVYSWRRAHREYRKV